MGAVRREGQADLGADSAIPEELIIKSNNEGRRGCFKSETALLLRCRERGRWERARFLPASSTLYPPQRSIRDSLSRSIGPQSMPLQWAFIEAPLLVKYPPLSSFLIICAMTRNSKSCEYYALTNYPEQGAQDVKENIAAPSIIPLRPLISRVTLPLPKLRKNCL